MVYDDKFPIAAQLFIRLKRSPGRVIDVTWMLENEMYALEVLRVARSADAESAELANRYEALLRARPGKAAAPAAQGGAMFARTGAFTAAGGAAAAASEETVAPEVGRHYVGALR
jgi:plasmid replication initiation protein